MNSIPNTRCTPTDKDKQSLKLDLYTVPFRVILQLTLARLFFLHHFFFGTFLIVFGRFFLFLTRFSSTTCKFFYGGSLLACLCVSLKSRASIFNLGWHYFFLLVFFYSQILYIGIAFRIKRCYLNDTDTHTHTDVHIKSYPYKLEIHSI